MNAEQIIKLEYGNSGNFITPKLEYYGKISDNIAYEVSSGKAMNNRDTIYGLTVVAYNPETNKTCRLSSLDKVEGKRISGCFSSLYEVKTHINFLKCIGEERLLAIKEEW